MSQNKEIRLSDIAHKLNISTVTVSKALSNKDGVSNELRTQIKDTASQMGYIPKKKIINQNKCTGNIGIIIPSHFFSPDYSFYLNIYNHLSEELLKYNYFCIMELLSAHDEKEHILPKIITEKKVDGIIFLGQVNEEYLTTVHSRYDNFILFDFYTKNSNYDCVINDDFFCSYQITNYVISQGHKKIRFVGTLNSTSSINDRFLGFQKAMYENNLNSSIEEVINDRNEQGLLIDIKLPQKNEMPTAFICNSDLTAANLIKKLEQNNYIIPQDISVTGFDNYLPNKIQTLPLTTVFINPKQSTKLAATLIINKIKGKEYSNGRNLVPGKLIIRDSVKKL